MPQSPGPDASISRHGSISYFLLMAGRPILKVQQQNPRAVFSIYTDTKVGPTSHRVTEPLSFNLEYLWALESLRLTFREFHRGSGSGIS